MRLNIVETLAGFRRIAILILAACLICASCATESPHKKTLEGAGAGAVIGAIIGAAVGGEDGAAIGALIGAAAGGAIGASLDAEDQRKRQAALGLASTQPVGDRSQWSSPQKGTSGSVARISDVFMVDGKQCMQVEETVSIEGKPETVQDTRCQDGSGQWIQASS